jgi:hypothetical protein
LPTSWTNNHQAQVTEPLLLEQLWEYGIDISAGQLHRILTENKEYFHQEKGEVLAAGLTSSSYIGTDDTGERHRGRNGYCTAIGNDLFACFESTDSKSRVNFLQVLQGSQRAYAINDTTLAYWERSAGQSIGHLAQEGNFTLENSQCILLLALLAVRESRLISSPSPA